MFRRCNVEFLACGRVRSGLGGRDFLGKVRGQAVQLIGINLDTRPFHIGQYGRHRAFQCLIDGGLALGCDGGFEDLPQAQGDVGILGGIGRGLVERHFVESDLGFSGATDLLKGDAGMSEMCLRQRVHAVFFQSGSDHIGQQHGVVIRRDLDVVAREYGQIVLEILADFQN